MNGRANRGSHAKYLQISGGSIFEGFERCIVRDFSSFFPGGYVSVNLAGNERKVNEFRSHLVSREMIIRGTSTPFNFPF